MNKKDKEYKLEEHIRKIRGRTYCIDLGGTCTGIYFLNEHKIALIDSGNKEAPEFLDWLEDNGFSVAAVIHTHLHGDHIANTLEIYRRYGARIIAQKGAQMYHKYLDEKLAFEIEENEPDSSIKVLDECFRFVSLPGHSSGHQMVITPNGVGFAGDAIMTENYLADSKIPYMADVRTSIESMKKLFGISLEACVCAHNGVIGKHDIDRVIQLNIDKEMKLYGMLEKTAAENIPLSCEALGQKFMIKAGVLNKEKRQYDWLVDTTERRIEELMDRGILEEKNGKIKWHPQPESNRQ